MLSLFAEANLIAACGFSLLAVSIVVVRRARNASVRNYMTLVSIVLGTFALFGTCGYVSLFVWPPLELAAARRGWIEDRRFDAELWRRGSDEVAGQRTRLAMIDHLLATHDDLVGESMPELAMTLGFPTFDHPWSANATTPPLVSCAYELNGPPEGIFDAQGWLVLVVGEDDRIVKAEVRWFGLD